MLHELLFTAARRYGISVRMPPSLFGPVLDINGRIQAMLEHLDYIQRSRGMKSTYGYAARGIANLKGPVSGMRDRLRQINGIGPATERMIKEMIDTGTCPIYDRAIRCKY